MIIHGTSYNKMSVDELREKIKIVYYEETIDNEGNIIKSKEPILRWEGFAKVYPIKSIIQNGYNEIVNEVDYRITIRYRTDIQYTDTIIYRNQKLKMMNVPFDLENKKRWLQMDCKLLYE
jgi:SPP1 family predicted phage head-tail adaptor